MVWTDSLGHTLFHCSGRNRTKEARCSVRYYYTLGQGSAGVAPEARPGWLGWKLQDGESTWASGCLLVGQGILHCLTPNTGMLLFTSWLLPLVTAISQAQIQELIAIKEKYFFIPSRDSWPHHFTLVLIDRQSKSLICTQSLCQMKSNYLLLSVLHQVLFSK